MKKIDKESIIGIAALLVHAAKIDEIYSSMEKNLITSDIKISAVLEIPKGCAKKLKVKKGQIVSWIIKKTAEIKNIRYFHCLNLKEK